MNRIRLYLVSDNRFVRESAKRLFDLAADIEVVGTGATPAIAIKEELFYEHEQVLPTSCEKIKRTNGSVRDWLQLCHQLEDLRASLSIDGADPIRARIKDIVPEYRFQEARAAENPCAVPAGVPT